MKHYYNDNDPHAVKWLRALIKANLIPPGDVDARSIKEIQPDDLRGYRQCHFFAGIGGWAYALRLAAVDATEPLWTGSCPCQPFSTAGSRLGEADPRHLWPELFRLALECRPAIILGEQIAGFDGLRWLEGVRMDLESASYAVCAADLCASVVGCPSRRRRLYWAAHAHEDRESLRPVDAEARSTQEVEELAANHWKTPPRARPFPLSDGLPYGMARCNASIGNAIVPQVAALFIRAFMESL